MVSNADGSARTRLPCPNATSAGGVPLPNINGGSLAEYERSSQMKPWMKVLILTLLVAVPAFLLSPVLFPPAEVGSEPSAAQIPFFMFLGAADAVLLGLGVSFLVFGLPVFGKVSPHSRVRAGYVPRNRLPDGLLVAAPEPERLDPNRGLADALVHRLPLPPAA